MVLASKRWRELDGLFGMEGEPSKKKKRGLDGIVTSLPLSFKAGPER